jgi:hypothetical protein
MLAEGVLGHSRYPRELALTIMDRARVPAQPVVMFEVRNIGVGPREMVAAASRVRR